MRILITGGNGLVGTPITRRFVELGWEAHVIGIEGDCDIPGASYAQCDICDADSLTRHMAGCDAVVHLAAISSTYPQPNPIVFQINVAGTYNVFDAAERAGIKRIAQASSINALGGYWGCDDRRFNYFPLDEAHPPHTTDSYSLSKQLVEDIGAYFWRRSGISSVSFRLPAVWSDELIEARQLRQDLAGKREALDAFRRLPEGEQIRRMEAAREQVLALRAGHVMEHDAAQAGIFDRDAPKDDPLFDSYFFDRFNYWTFIHTVDSTRAFELAITSDYDGAHALFVNSDRNYLAYESEALLSLFYPDVRERSRAIEGDEALVSIDRARELLGFQPTARAILPPHSPAY